MANLSIQLQRGCFINPWIQTALFLIIAIAATSAAVSWQFAGCISLILFGLVISISTDYIPALLTKYGVYNAVKYFNRNKLDMSMARRRLKSPRSLSGTSAHPTMVTLDIIMVMNGWPRSFSFHVNRPPHSRDKSSSDSDLETPRSRSWVWSKGKVIQSAQYHINSLHFHFTSIRPTIPEIELFRNLTLKHPRSRSWVRSKVKVAYCIQYTTNALPFRFTSQT